MRDQGISEATHVGGSVTNAARFGVEVSLRMIDEIDTARARHYQLLASLLTRAPDQLLLAQLATIQGDSSPLGIARIGLAEAAASAQVEAVEGEFFNLFIGLGRGELLPYGSYYLTGFLHERPLARLRGALAEIGIERAQRVGEPEDHIGILCEIMAGLIEGAFDAPADAEKRIFDSHIAPWAARFFADLEHAESARLYRSVGVLGRTFIDIEMQAFALPS